jgi:hypothetical protein
MGVVLYKGKRKSLERAWSNRERKSLEYGCGPLEVEEKSLGWVWSLWEEEEVVRVGVVFLKECMRNFDWSCLCMLIYS